MSPSLATGNPSSEQEFVPNYVICR